MDIFYDYKHYSTHAFLPSLAVSSAKQILYSFFFISQMLRPIWIQSIFQLLGGNE